MIELGQVVHQLAEGISRLVIAQQATGAVLRQVVELLEPTTTYPASTGGTVTVS